jgi:hypothetical protein
MILYQTSVRVLGDSTFQQADSNTKSRIERFKVYSCFKRFTFEFCLEAPRTAVFAFIEYYTLKSSWVNLKYSWRFASGLFGGTFGSFEICFARNRFWMRLSLFSLTTVVVLGIVPGPGNPCP